MSVKKIVVADFFGTVKERGIAAYVRDLTTIAEPLASVKLLQAPRWVRYKSTALQNALLILHEQIIVPIYVLLHRPNLVIYPYNSCSFLLSLSPRTVCVIHDLIPYRARTRSSGLAFRYVACTARWHARLKRRFVGVSPFTVRTLKALPRFKQSQITYVPNCFGSMESRGDDKPTASSIRRVTLISGTGPNKAFAETITLMESVLDDPRLADLAFDIVGFGPDHAYAEAMIADAKDNGRTLPTMTVHPLLPRAKLDAMLTANAVTWAHSHAEGFGRAIVEGRIARRPVVMSQLTVFKALQDRYTFHYSNHDHVQFRESLAQAIDVSNEAGPYDLVNKLRQDATTGVEMLLCN